jgi:hypothetical protein
METAYAESFAYYLEDDAEALRQFGNELDTMSQQNKLYMQEMANSAVDLIDETKYTADEMAQIRNAANSDVA